MSKQKKISLAPSSEQTKTNQETQKMNQKSNNATEINEKLFDLKNEFENNENSESKKESAYKRKKRKTLEQDEQFAGSVSNVGSMALSLIIERMPKNIPLTDEERKQFDQATSALILKYVSYLGNYKEETAFATILILILVPRLNLFKSKSEGESENGVEKTS